MQRLLIEYENASDTITLEYRLRDNPVVERWVERVATAQAKWPIDDPKRFYGFGTLAEQCADALAGINQCCDIINSVDPVIKRRLTDLSDQDTLNYLHHIFEIHHGLLDQQNSALWQKSPDSVRKALADLNIWVHRCESVARGAQPRHVITWFGLPKTRELEESDYQYFTNVWKPGTVFLNYVEIGKTIQDLAEDNDQYIAPEAFKPFKHYSADFVVRFYEQTQTQADEKYAIMSAYYAKHREFFGPWQPCYTPGNLPVADLISPVDLDVLAKYQSVKSVSIN